jgi:hypothetical protein
MLNMAFSMMSARQKQKFKETTEIDMAYGVAGLGRFRVNIFQQRGNVGLVLRVIPTKIRALDELFLPKVVEQICDMPRGLVLVTGVTGSGKSTTLAAMVDRINSTRAEHIITIEDPIEFLHRAKKGYVNQREIEVDTPSFQRAARFSSSGSRRGFWSAKCATLKRSGPRCTRPKPATWCSPRCTLWTPSKASTESSPFSRRLSRNKSDCSWPLCCGPS